MDDCIKREINALVEGSRDIIVCSVDGDGYPQAKGMFKTIHDGVRTFLFSTNTSSLRVAQFLANPKASIFFVDHESVRGLMLTGAMEVLHDDESRAQLWHPGDEQYYPLGPTDPDYCVLRFTALRGNYYHALQKHLFDVAEMD